MARHECPHCGAPFHERSSYEMHLKESHPEFNVNAAELERATTDVEYPRDKEEMLLHAQGGEPQALGLLDEGLATRPRRTARTVRSRVPRARKGVRSAGRTRRSGGRTAGLKARRRIQSRARMPSRRNNRVGARRGGRRTQAKGRRL